MTNNSNKTDTHIYNTDTHIYNIINNPSPAFTEPCEACGVSEFQLGVRHERERILAGLASQHEELEQLLIMANLEGINENIELVEARIIDLEHFIAFVNEEPSIYDFEPTDKGEQQ